MIWTLELNEPLKVQNIYILKLFLVDDTFGEKEWFKVIPPHFLKGVWVGILTHSSNPKFQTPTSVLWKFVTDPHILMAPGISQ